MVTVDATTLGAALHDLWRDMRDGRGEQYALGAIALAFAVGLLTLEQRELWERRIATCPGHDDEGGRVWCAYCGDIPRDEEAQEADG